LTKERELQLLYDVTDENHKKKAREPAAVEARPEAGASKTRNADFPTTEK